MPRRTRAYQVTKASETLDAAVGKYDAAEKRLNDLAVELKKAVVAMGREVLSKETDVTMAEVARRVGWSREYVSRIVSDANKVDGWKPPSRPDKP